MNKVRKFVAVKAFVQGYVWFHQPESGIEALKGLIFMEATYRLFIEENDLNDTRRNREAYQNRIGTQVSKIVIRVLTEARRRNKL